MNHMKKLSAFLVACLFITPSVYSRNSNLRPLIAGGLGALAFQVLSESLTQAGNAFPEELNRRATKLNQALTDKDNFTAAHHAQQLKKLSQSFIRGLYTYERYNDAFAGVLESQVYNQNLPAVQFLIEGRWIDPKSSEASKVLVATARNSTTATADYLINAGVKTDGQTERGTALHEAVKLMKPEFVEYYLKKGVPVNAAWNNMTALDIADSLWWGQGYIVGNRSEDLIKIRKMLEDAGAKRLKNPKVKSLSCTDKVDVALGTKVLVPVEGVKKGTQENSASH